MSFLDTIIRKFINLFKKERIEEPSKKRADEIVPETSEKITKFVNKDIIVKRIKNINFIFDKKSLKEFESFADDFNNIIVKDGYLARKQKGKAGYITFFHIWLMEDEIEKFKQNHDYWGDVDVHHLYGKIDNRKSTLTCLRKPDHREKIHNRESPIINNQKKIKEFLK